MMRQNPFAEKPSAPERVPNDGEPSAFASPDRRQTPAGAQALETKLHDRLRGLFAITDGETSTVGGHAAGLSVAEELQRQLGAALDTKLENVLVSRAPEDRRRPLIENLVSSSVELALMEAHRRLALANGENPSIRLRAQGAVARMVELAPNQKELFYTLGGTGRLYLVRDGEVFRLGEEKGAALVAPGTLGEDVPMTVVHKEVLEPGDKLFLLGDGAARVLRGVDIKEAAKETADARVLERALQGFAKAKVEQPGNHDAKAGDLSVIAWDAFPAARPKPKAEAAMAETGAARRSVLRARIKRAADAMSHNRAFSTMDAGGRQLLGAEEANVRLESEQADAELELLNMDVPPRFAAGDRVTLATGKTYDVKGYAEGKYALRDVRFATDETLLRPRWEIEMAVDPAALPVRAGDRIRVEGFTATAADDWHIMDSAHPADRFLFEDGKAVHRMNVPAHLTRQALHGMLTDGHRLQNRTFALRRQVEKSRRPS